MKTIGLSSLKTWGANHLDEVRIRLARPGARVFISLLGLVTGIVAGVVFAPEVIMMEYSVTSFIPVILASVSATALSREVNYYIVEWFIQHILLSDMQLVEFLKIRHQTDFFILRYRVARMQRGVDPKSHLAYKAAWG